MTPSARIMQFLVDCPGAKVCHISTTLELPQSKVQLELRKLKEQQRVFVEGKTRAAKWSALT